MSLKKTLRGRRQRKNLVERDGSARKLRLEMLEDRRMLATMVVTDLGDGSLASLSGDGQLSLREAVEAINTAAPVDGIGPSAGLFGSNDAIVFEPALFGGTPETLALTAGQLELQSGVIIFGPGSGLLTLDAQQNSRIFDIAAGSDDFVIAKMKLTGGLTTGLDQPGGAIRSLTTGEVSISNSTLVGNGTTGHFSNGGAVSTMGSVILVDSSILNNRTEGTSGVGGGIFAAKEVTLVRSTVANNRTMSSFSSGGGITSNTTVSLSSSTVSGNRVNSSSAGGILAISGVELTESTVSGNVASNLGSVSGGGISSGGTISITRSTIVNNAALGFGALGGGIKAVDRIMIGENGELIIIPSEVIISGSIIANNSSLGSNDDIEPGSGTLTVEFSLIGDATGLGISSATNILNQDPLLGPLTGGGITETHAPLPSSPVIDAGDELIVAAPVFDQRGTPFLRIADGDGNGSSVIDMGSHEVQSPASADFDFDDDVDGADFLAWQRGFGKTSAAVAVDGDADHDEDVDSQDLATWQHQFGSVAPVAVSVSDRVSLIDLAIAVEPSDSEQTDSDLASLSQTTIAAESTSREQAFAAIFPVLQAVAIEADVLASAQASEDVVDGDVAFDDELVVTAI